MARNTFHLARSLKSLSNLLLTTSRDWASTTFLANMLGCCTTLTVKKFLPNSWCKPTEWTKPDTWMNFKDEPQLCLQSPTPSPSLFVALCLFCSCWDSPDQVVPLQEFQGLSGTPHPGPLTGHLLTGDSNHSTERRGGSVTEKELLK